MKRKLLSALLSFWFTAAAVVCAQTGSQPRAGSPGVGRTQTLDQEMSVLADKLSKALVARGFKKVAAVDFTDLQRQPTELGRYLSERLSVEMAGVTMVDRAIIQSILTEHNLTVEGLVDPANAKELGHLAGVDAILMGIVTDLDVFDLMVKAMSTDSTAIASERITFPKTPALTELWHRRISAGPALTASLAPATGGGRASYQEATAIAMKDIGSLRVVLKSVAPVVLKNQRRGLRVSFEFMSRETRRPLVVAINAEGPPSPDAWRPSTPPTGTVLRSSVLDDRGGVWNLSSPDLYGLDFVRVGVHGRNGQDPYSPSEIVRLLRLRDELGRDADDPSDGTYANADTLTGVGTNYTYGPGGNVSPRKFFPFSGNKFISGSTTTIEPGQSIMVTMSFVQDPPQTFSGSLPQFFQFHSEIVVGVVAGGPNRSYSLNNLTFDRVSMPVF